MNSFSKILIGLGFSLIGVGIFWQLGSKFLHLGRLPGDIAIEKPNFKFYFPLTSSLAISIIVSLILYFIQHFLSPRK